VKAKKPTTPQSGLSLLSVVSILVLYTVGTHTQAQTPKNWVLIAKNVLSSQEDLYVDTNFRQEVSKEVFMVSTLSNVTGKAREVEVFGDDGTGETRSVFLTGKRYQSSISVVVFSCTEKKRGEYLTIYKAEAMGKGKTIYRDDASEDRGSRGDFIPMFPLSQLPGEDTLRKFACTGRLTATR
jgi:hypothetical protein